MKSIAIFILSISLAGLAVAGEKAKVKMSDIAEVLESNPDKNTMLVRTYEGKKYLLRLSEKQMQAIEKNVLASNNEETIMLQEEASSTTTTTTTVSSSTSTSKVKVEDVKKEEKKSNWGSSFLKWTSSNVDKFHNGEAATNHYLRYTIQYNTDNNYAFKFRPTFSVDYDFESTAATHNLADWVLEAQKKGLNLFGFSVSPYIRYYLPTGSASRKADSAGQLYVSGKFNKQINSVISVYYWPTARYYLNSKASDVTFDEFDRVSSVPKGNTSLRFQNTFGIDEKINDTFTLGQAIQLDNRFRYNDPEVGLEENENTTELEWELSLGMSFVDWLSLTLALTNKDQIGGDDGFSLVSAEKMTYHFVANVTFF